MNAAIGRKFLKDTTAKELAHIIGSKPVFLVGSFISTYLPTNVPSGEKLTEGLYHFIFGAAIPHSSQPWPDWLKEDFEQQPFEALMEVYPNKDRLPSIVRQLFSRGVPNPLHRCLCDALTSEKISAIITTNYDLCFDSCLRNSFVKKVVQESDLNSGSGSVPNTKVYFKIHGSAGEALEGTLVFNLGREGVIEPWKRALLSALLSNRVLVVIGYSGRDFEICPELERVDGLRRVVWLQKTEREPRPNPARVLRARNGLVLIGDLSQLLKCLFDPGLNAESGPSSLPNFAQYFDVGLIDLWRVRILDRMACCSLGTPLAEQLPDQSSMSIQRIRRSMFGHAGKYRTAARAALRMASTPGISGRDRVECLLAASGSFFASGDYLLSSRYLRSAERAARATSTDECETLILQSKLTRWMRLAQFARIFRATRFLQTIQRKSKPIYEHLLDLLEAAGEWDALQTIHHNAERIGYADPKRYPLPADVGYSNLGLKGMECIRVRDWIRAGTWRLAEEKARAAEHWIKVAEQYGWNHESWKLKWILLLRAPTGRLCHFWSWWNRFRATEYSLLGRLSQLILSLVPRASG